MACTRGDTAMRATASISITEKYIVKKCSKIAGHPYTFVCKAWRKGIAEARGLSGRRVHGVQERGARHDGRLVVSAAAAATTGGEGAGKRSVVQGEVRVCGGGRWLCRCERGAAGATVARCGINRVPANKADVAKRGSSRLPAAPGPHEAAPTRFTSSTTQPSAGARGVQGVVAAAGVSRARPVFRGETKTGFYCFLYF